MAEHAEHSPLTQFEVQPLPGLPQLKIGDIDISFTNASLWMFIAVAAVWLLMYMGIRKRALVPNRWQSVSEMLVQFISDTLRDSAGREGLRFFPLIFTLFLFLSMCNMVGMVPYSFTPTSHIIFTFALAACVFLGCVLLAIVRHGPVEFMHFFMPHGAPLWLAPLLIPIELFSFMARPVSLSIRLAANMMAGHVLLKVLAGFVIAMGIWGIAPLSFLVLMTGFEIGICLLQAYVFTILTCVYLNDALNLHSSHDL